MDTKGQEEARGQVAQTVLWQEGIIWAAEVGRRSSQKLEESSGTVTMKNLPRRTRATAAQH